MCIANGHSRQDCKSLFSVVRFVLIHMVDVEKEGREWRGWVILYCHIIDACSYTQHDNICDIDLLLVTQAF